MCCSGLLADPVLFARQPVDTHQREELEKPKASTSIEAQKDQISGSIVEGKDTPPKTKAPAASVPDIPGIVKLAQLYLQEAKKVFENLSTLLSSHYFVSKILI